MPCNCLRLCRLPEGCRGAVQQRQGRPCSAIISAAPSASSSRARFIAGRSYSAGVERLRRPLPELGLGPSASARGSDCDCEQRTPRKVGGDMRLLISVHRSTAELGEGRIWLACVPPRRLRPSESRRRCRDMLLQPERPPATSHAAQSACGEGPVEAAAHAGAMQARFSPYDYNGGCASCCASPLSSDASPAVQPLKPLGRHLPAVCFLPCDCQLRRAVLIAQSLCPSCRTPWQHDSGGGWQGLLHRRR